MYVFFGGYLNENGNTFQAKRDKDRLIKELDEDLEKNHNNLKELTI